jgi:hypothetical protein
MASTQQARSNIISDLRQEVDNLLTAIEKLNALSAQWDAGYSLWIIDASGDDPEAAGYDPGDFVGSNQGLMKTDLANALYSLTAINTVVNNGHRVNLEKVRP